MRKFAFAFIIAILHDNIKS